MYTMHPRDRDSSSPAGFCLLEKIILSIQAGRFPENYPPWNYQITILNRNLMESVMLSFAKHWSIVHLALVSPSKEGSKDTLPETNSQFAVKIDGWKMNFPFFGFQPIFSGASC